jgi:hypothetical protein
MAIDDSHNPSKTSAQEMEMASEKGAGYSSESNGLVEEVEPVVTPKTWLVVFVRSPSFSCGMRYARPKEIQLTRRRFYPWATVSLSGQYLSWLLLRLK